jgi:outer membrane murein-binding lipoprotein Lpp
MTKLLLGFASPLLMLLVGIYLVNGMETEFTQQVNSVSTHLDSLDTKIEQLSEKLNRSSSINELATPSLKEQVDSSTATKPDNGIELRLAMMEHQLSSLLEAANKGPQPSASKVEAQEERPQDPGPPQTRQEVLERVEEAKQNQVQLLENRLQAKARSVDLSNSVRGMIDSAKTSNEYLAGIDELNISCNGDLCKVEFETPIDEDISPDIVEIEVAAALSKDLPVSQMSSVEKTATGYKYTSYFIASEQEPAR